MNEDNPVANLSLYELTHLSDHLEKTGRICDLHRLLALETTSKRNAWYEAQESVGNTLVFLSDIKRAARLARNESSQLTDNGKLDSTLALEVRYALMTASFNSRASKIPSSAIAARINLGNWTSAQGTAYVEQMPTTREYFQGSISLSSSLPKVSKMERIEKALSTIKKFESKNAQAQALLEITPYLPKSLLKKALDIADSSFGRPCSQTLYKTSLELAKLGSLNKSLGFLNKSLSLVWLIRFKDDQASAYHRIAPYLPEWYRGKVFEQAEKSVDKIGFAEESSVQFDIMCRDLARMIYRHEALIILPSQLSHEDNLRVSTIFQIVKRMAELGLTKKALRIANSFDNLSKRIEVLVAIFPYLSEKLKSQTAVKILESINNIRFPVDQILALTSIEPYLPTSLKESELNRFFSLVKKVDEVDHQDVLLAALIPLLPETFFPETLLLAKKTNQQNNPYALKAFALRLAHLGRTRNAITTAHEIKDENVRLLTLTTLASNLSDPLRSQTIAEALILLRKIKSFPSKGVESFNRKKLSLSTVAVKLAQLGKYDESLSIIWETEEPFGRESSLAVITPFLPKSRASEEFERSLKTLKINDKKNRIELLKSWKSNQSSPDYFPKTTQDVKKKDVGNKLFEKAKAKAHELSNEGYMRESFALKSHAKAIHLALNGNFEAAFSTSQEFADDLGFLEDMVLLLPELTKNSKHQGYTLLRELLNRFYKKDRQTVMSLLKDMLPVIVLFTGTEGVEQILVAVNDVTNWWE